MPTIAVMPMTTPSTVSPERILLVRTVSNAITTTSASNAILKVIRFLVALRSQCFDRSRPRGAHRRVEAEEQADPRRDADAEPDRPYLDCRRPRRERRDGGRDRRAEHRADDAAEQRQHHRLGEDL